MLKIKINKNLSHIVSCILLFFLWRRLRRDTIRGDLEIVLAEVVSRAAVWKRLVPMWTVFWGLCRVSQRFPVVRRQFQKSEGTTGRRQ